MRRLLFLLPLFLLAQCGGGDPSPEPKPKKARRAETQAPVAAPTEAEEEAREAGDDAAAVLRNYYDHIQAGRYDDAWAMRGGKADGAEAFARNFAGYQSYQVSLGEPSQPVAGDGWDFVEVPIMITGRMSGGKGFGSAGSITLRRSNGAPNATAVQKGWHIYTGD
ncbi:MAG TPA: hypothetical protein VGC35_04770 [Allosphingosinicella sp.]|jgi:hypothetical protein